MLKFGNWRKAVDSYQGPSRENANPYDQDETERVFMAHIRAPWHPKMVSYLDKIGVKGLSFSFRDGFTCENYNFLKEFQFLELLHVPNQEPKIDFGMMPISSISSVKRIATSNKLAYPIDFSQLPELLSWTIKWQKKGEGIFDAKRLKRLQISSLNWQQTGGLANLQTL